MINFILEYTHEIDKTFINYIDKNFKLFALFVIQNSHNNILFLEIINLCK